MKKRLLLGATLGAYLWTQKTPQVQIILNNKVVVVTGASSGIGKAAALAFAAKGARVVLIARRENLLNEVAAEIKEKFCAETLVIPADISLEKDLSRIITEVEAKFGHIDILVNFPTGKRLAVEQALGFLLGRSVATETNGTYNQRRDQQTGKRALHG
jgi:NADPH:quinone reductase-like Zn-dependent oxidoreductase